MSVHTHRTWHNYAGQPPVRNPSLAALPLTARPLHSSCTQFSPCQQQLRPFINTSLLVELLETADFQDRSLWLWRNEARFSPCFIVCGFSGNRRCRRIFGSLKMVIFGDEDNMVERFVEIDARVFREGTAHVASGFSVNGPRPVLGVFLESRCEALTQGLILRMWLLSTPSIARIKINKSCTNTTIRVAHQTRCHKPLRSSSTLVGLWHDRATSEALRFDRLVCAGAICAGGRCRVGGACSWPRLRRGGESVLQAI